MNREDLKIYAIIITSIAGPFVTLELIRIYTPLI